MIRIIKYRRIFLTISALLVLTSILSLIFIGFKPGIDFTGGTLMEVEFKKSRPDIILVREKLNSLDLGIASVQPSAERGAIIRAKDLNNEQRNKILKTLEKDFKDAGKVKELRFESIGPSVGKELKNKAIIAVVIASICMILYIAYVFRKMSSTVSSWKMGICAILALIHDILIICGIFVLLGYFKGVEIDVLFVSALLVVLGYSVNDTIVVFDRIRDNVLKDQSIDLEVNTELSLNQTLVRSLGTGIATLLVLLSLYLFGGQAIQWFIFALIVGIIVGSYSSIFVASCLLVEWEKWDKRRK
ncbi:MAG: protein translocase subunit SecF [Patescibacteria group bacterium]|nr:protein translocase subunit SecF [Patescibacteria group bacterium]